MSRREGGEEREMEQQTMSIQVKRCLFRANGTRCAGRPRGGGGGEGEGEREPRRRLLQKDDRGARGTSKA
jgi:hypothetical protein